MSSGGQIIGGIVGGVIGSLTGNPFLGAQLGMMAGGMLDPPKGPTIEGPRLEDLSMQTSTYGSVIPRVYGTVTVNGNILWLQGNKLTEVVTKKKTGGKGGSSKSTSRQYSYYATFAVGLCAGPIVAARRIWIGERLIYDAGSDDVPTIMASNAATDWFTLYHGTDIQLPDPRIQADVGVANTPAWRGLAYVVIRDFALATYGNSLMGAQVRVEIITTGHEYDYPFAIHDVATSGENWSRVVWDGTVFCSVDRASGTNRVCTISTDGEIWTNSPMPAAAQDFLDISASPSGAIIVTHVGLKNYVQRSVDHGVTWQTITLPITMRCERVGYGGGIFAIVGPYDKKVLYSLDDGLSWTLATALTAGANSVGYCSDVFWSDYYGKFFACYSNAGVNTYVISSSDGVSWSTSTLAYVDANWQFLVALGATVVISGTTANGAYVSTNGSSWTRIPYPTFPLNGLQGMDTDGNVILMLRQGGYSTTVDLVSFTAHSFFPLSVSWRPPAWSGAAFVSVGNVDRESLVIVRRQINIQSATLSSIVSSECLQSGLLTSGDIDVTALSQSVRGYLIGSIGAIRSALEPLRAAWPFDVVQHGYNIKFVVRSGASIVTISAQDLDAHGAGKESEVRITTSREMDSHLPRRVTVKHLDYDREYNIGTQYAERMNTVAVNTTVLDLPIVLTASEAAGKAEVLLYLYWLERYDVAITLPPTYNQLEPGDVVTLVTPEGNVSLRLTAVNYTSDGRVECKAKYANAAIYTPTAVGVSSAVSGPTTITRSGKSQFFLMNLPLMNSAQGDFSMVAAVAGIYDGWPGGSLMQSRDAGVTWTDVALVDPPGSTMGVCDDSLLTPADWRSWDFASKLTARLSSGDLSSVANLTLLTGENLFAYGRPGDGVQVADYWEIIAAKTCTWVSGDTYVLRDFLRGLFGTEWAMGSHAIGDRIVKLESDLLSVVSMTKQMLGTSYEYKAITDGLAIDSDYATRVMYVAIGLKPLAPVYLRGHIDAVGDWNLFWHLRVRGGSGLEDYGSGETVESYELEIYASGSFGTVKRTLTSGSAKSVVYDSASQTADFGAAQTTLYVKIYQISSTIGRGYPMVATITG